MMGGRGGVGARGRVRGTVQDNAML
jgi:hypothetical protein